MKRGRWFQCPSLKSSELVHVRLTTDGNHLQMLQPHHEMGYLESTENILKVTMELNLLHIHQIKINGTDLVNLLYTDNERVVLEAEDERCMREWVLSLLYIINAMRTDPNESLPSQLFRQAICLQCFELSQEKTISDALNIMEKMYVQLCDREEQTVLPAFSDLFRLQSDN